MFIKNGNNWDRRTNFQDSEEFKNLLTQLKTYSKCFNSATYSTSSTLKDVYENIKYAKAFWVQTTDFAPDELNIFGLTLKKGYFYNLFKHIDKKTILDSIELRSYMEKGWIKASNSKLFEDIEDPTRKEWFCFYQPRKTNQYINEPFDFLVIRYNLVDPISRDVDTRTSIVNSSYTGFYKENNITVN